MSDALRKVGLGPAQIAALARGSWVYSYSVLEQNYDSWVLEPLAWCSNWSYSRSSHLYNGKFPFVLLMRKNEYEKRENYEEENNCSLIFMVLAIPFL